jgi:hypothetical protein
VEAAVNGLFDPVVIERKIDGLLQDSGGALKRSSLLTLVIVHPRERQAEMARRMDYIFGKRPLRVIRIETGYGAATTVDVSARCLPHPAGEEVCFQEIVFYSGADQRGLDPALWQPLIIRDLPAVLFCLEGTALLRRVVRHMDFMPDKCLVDTGAEGAGAAPVAYLEMLTGLAALAEAGVPVADLSWRALTGLRLLAARLFDPPETRPLLKDLSRVDIRGLAPSSCLVLGLWLAARLGWKNGVLRGESMSFTGARGNNIVLALPPRAGARFSLDFHSAAGAHAGLRQVDDTTVLLLSSGREYREPYAVSGCDTCLLEEIDRLESDRAFLETLAAAMTVRVEA